MTIREYLSQIAPADQEINRKISRLAVLRADAMRMTAVARDAPGGSGGERSFEERMQRYLLLRDEIMGEIDRLTDLKQEICTLIDSLPNENCRTVVEMHYLHNLSFPVIARSIGYSQSGIEKLHRKALRQLMLTGKRETEKSKGK